MQCLGAHVKPDTESWSTGSQAHSHLNVTPKRLLGQHTHVHCALGAGTEQSMQPHKNVHCAHSHSCSSGLLSSGQACRQTGLSSRGSGSHPYSSQRQLQPQQAVINSQLYPPATANSSRLRAGLVRSSNHRRLHHHRLHHHHLSSSRGHHRHHRHHRSSSSSSTLGWGLRHPMAVQAAPPAVAKRSTGGAMAPHLCSLGRPHTPPCNQTARSRAAVCVRSKGSHQASGGAMGFLQGAVVMLRALPRRSGSVPHPSNQHQRRLQGPLAHRQVAACLRPALSRPLP